jgi:hypothetical protein
MNKKAIHILIIISIIIALLVRLIIWVNDDNSYDVIHYSIKDEEYLDVKKLSKLPTSKSGYDDVSEEIAALAEELISTSYETNGKLPEEYEGIVSERDFNYLGLVFKSDRNYDEMIANGTVYKEHSYEIMEVKHNFNKAIVDYCDQLLIISKEDGEILSKRGSSKQIPSKIYLEQQEGKWIIISVFLHA